MARQRKGRAIGGVVLLDKPQGLTSNAALQRVRRLFNARKAGHTGSLDPLATGVLPICLGEATKYSSFLLDANKAYYTRASLGVITTTGDSDGEVVERSEVPAFSRERLEMVLDDLRGPIKQVPSMFSALKHNGRPLYEYARKGITIDRPARDVTIYSLEIIELSENTIELKVECSKGTYIRSLVEDIGKALGCGAHVSMLRRYKAGGFALSETYTLDQLEALANEGSEREFEAGQSVDSAADYSRLDALLLPIDRLLADLPEIRVNNAQSRSLLQGQAVRIAPAQQTGLAKVYLETGEQAVNSDQPMPLVGVVELSEDGLLTPKRMMSEALVY